MPASVLRLLGAGAGSFARGEQIGGSLKLSTSDGPTWHIRYPSLFPSDEIAPPYPTNMRVPAQQLSKSQDGACLVGKDKPLGNCARPVKLSGLSLAEGVIHIRMYQAGKNPPIRGSPRLLAPVSSPSLPARASRSELAVFAMGSIGQPCRGVEGTLPLPSGGRGWHPSAHWGQQVRR